MQLEAKLKEVKDKKKKKAEMAESKNLSHIDAIKHDNCANMLKNVDVKFKISGISAVGEANIDLKYGNSGNPNLIRLNLSHIYIKKPSYLFNRTMDVYDLWNHINTELYVNINGRYFNDKNYLLINRKVWLHFTIT